MEDHYKKSKKSRIFEMCINATVVYMVLHGLLNVVALPALTGKVSFETLIFSVLAIGYLPIITTGGSVCAMHIKYS